MLQLDSTGKILNDSMFRTNTSADYIERAAKVTCGLPTLACYAALMCALIMLHE